MADISLISSLASFVYFVSLTSVYFFLKFFSKTSKMVMIWTIVYFLILIVSQFFINTSISTNLCGTPQYVTILIVTIIPWVIMLGTIKMLLTVFPGWLSPFSNTFGYIITKIFGINDILNSILVENFDKKEQSDDVKIAAKALEHIYTDKSLLINEITQENFNTFWTRMSKEGLFKDNITDELKEKLRSMVILKDTVSEYIWYILTGGLVTSVSYNYMVNSECVKSVKELEKNVAEAQDNITTAADNKEEIVYKS